MQGMYLDPLAKLVADNGGLVYNVSAYMRLCDAVTLMVDIKQGGGAVDPNASFVALHSVLEGYQGMRNPGLRGFCLLPSTAAAADGCNASSVVLYRVRCTAMNMR